MNTTHRHSRGSDDGDDLGDVEDLGTTPRWWILIWLAWGLILGTLVLWFDRNPSAAALWLLVGVAVGTCALRIFGPFSTPVFDWFHHFASAPEKKHRMVELLIEEKTDSEEFKRLLEEEVYWMTAMIPPTCGLVHGPLFGAIGGALGALDPTLDITVSQGALYGILFGMLGFPFIAAGITAVMVPTDKTQPLTTRIARRGLMLVSPLLVIPLIWHCFRWMFKGRPADIV